MCSKQKRSFKSKHFQHEYGIKIIKNVNKMYTIKCDCKFDSIKQRSNQEWNNDKCWCEYKI